MKRFFYWKCYETFFFTTTVMLFLCSPQFEQYKVKLQSENFHVGDTQTAYSMVNSTVRAMPGNVFFNWKCYSELIAFHWYGLQSATSRRLVASSPASAFLESSRNGAEHKRNQSLYCKLLFDMAPAVTLHLLQQNLIPAYFSHFTWLYSPIIKRITVGLFYLVTMSCMYCQTKLIPRFVHSYTAFCDECVTSLAEQATDFMLRKCWTHNKWQLVF